MIYIDTIMTKCNSSSQLKIKKIIIIIIIKNALSRPLSSPPVPSLLLARLLLPGFPLFLFFTPLFYLCFLEFCHFPCKGYDTLHQFFNSFLHFYQVLITKLKQSVDGKLSQLSQFRFTRKSNSVYCDHFLLKTTELKLSSGALTQDTRFHRSYLAVKLLDHLPVPTLFTQFLIFNTGKSWTFNPIQSCIIHGYTT